MIHFVPGDGSRRIGAIISSDSAAHVNEEQAIGKRSVQVLYLPIFAVQQAREGEMELLHALADTFCTLCSIGFLTVDPLVGEEMMVRIADVYEQELDLLSVGLVQTVQVNHLLAKYSSAEATEDEADRFAAPEIAKANHPAVVQAWQGKIGCGRANAQNIRIFQKKSTELSFPLRQANIDDRSGQRSHAHEKHSYCYRHPACATARPCPGGQAYGDHTENTKRNVQPDYRLHVHFRQVGGMQL